MNRDPLRCPPRQLLLAGALMLLPAIATSATAGSDIPLAGATIAVANCNDSGPGSLRDAIANAATGDTIDMSSLACRTINLTSGAIAIAQRDLSLDGGPPGLMKVDAGHRSGVFRHTGRGWLRIDRLNIANGRYAGDTTPRGGCLYSDGKIELVNSKVHGCSVGPARGYGAGIFAWGNVILRYSWVTGNTSSFVAGGIGAYRGLLANHSHVSDNRADVASAVWVEAGPTTANYSTFSNNRGGGVIETASGGDLYIANSTISGNTSTRTGWSIISNSGSSFDDVTIVESTISGNTTTGNETISLTGDGARSIINSTIAFNRDVGPCEGSGNATLFVSGGATLLDSTVISNNSCNGNARPSVFGNNLRAPSVLTGADNLITTTGNIALPPDTISVDPKLAPLADNGGPTMTHALPADSPAIDNGNNEAGLEFDQRGKGHPRVNGSQTDIGAFER